MITITLTETEAILLCAVLDMASAHYGNHGCNDFCLDRHIHKESERTQLQALMAIWNDSSGVDGPPQDSRYTQDYMVMSYLHHIIKGQLQPTAPRTIATMSNPWIITDDLTYCYYCGEEQPESGRQDRYGKFRKGFSTEAFEDACRRAHHSSCE